MTPTQLTLRELSKQGYVAQVVEKWNCFAHVRQDLFGIIDIVAIHPEHIGVLGIQTTSHSNKSARVTKSKNNPILPLWLSSQNRFEVWTWKKQNGRWVHAVVSF